MNKYCLQNILFPKLEICREMELYFRPGKGKLYNYKFEDYIKLDKGEFLDFGTYFNAFSYGVWKRYTNIDNVNLKLNLKGQFKIQIYQIQLVNNDVIEKSLKSFDVDCEEKKQLKIEINAFDNRGQIGFSLKAIGNDAYFYGGQYFTLCNNEIHLPRMAIDICTYHREAYVYRNFSNLKKHINLKSDDILLNNVDFYIVDNGQTLDEQQIELSNVKVIKQLDCGSTGGFVRGMIEIITRKKKYDRLLLLDDDILFEPEIIERLIFFVAFLKREYQDNFIGGGNLDLNIPWMQRESGGYFDEIKYISCGLNYDMRNPYFLLKNEFDRNATSSAWWCCCVPYNYVEKDNLPYPFFFHREDMEYSYRNKKSVILLNGIGVWHESFFNKQPSWHVYYDTRNQMILNSLHFSTMNLAKSKKILLRKMITYIVRYRYRECEFLLDAYRDYLRGPEWLRKNDDAQYLEEKIEQSYRIEYLAESLDFKKYEERIEFEESLFRKIIRILTINGYILPTKKVVITPLSDYSSSVSFRAIKIINYDFQHQKGFVVERSLKTATKYFFRMLKMFVELDFKMKKAQEKYREDFSIAIKLETWINKLNLK